MPAVCFRGFWSDERGSGSVLAAAIVAALLALLGVVVPLTSALAVKQRVVAATDAAALAAADAASGAVAGVPCDVAATAVQLGGARLLRCEVHGAFANVTANSSYLGLTITVSARAGPPASAGGG